ncbi:MAG: helix-turn-helix domain-containing protein [Candidatus Scalindua sp.]|nr:helix-turn-helix domain-containing protein [Candidatus Scalindua sp.]
MYLIKFRRKTVTEIHQELNRTRAWVYKWLERAESGGKGGIFDKSKEPHHKPGKINKELEIVSTVESRKKLVTRG